jgi:hypothetical protein
MVDRPMTETRDALVRDLALAFAAGRYEGGETLFEMYANIALKFMESRDHAPTPAVPDSYVLMPREATRAMTMAGCDSLPSCEHVFGHAGEMLRNAYAKMVTVADSSTDGHTRFCAIHTVGDCTCSVSSSDTSTVGNGK